MEGPVAQELAQLVEGHHRPPLGILQGLVALGGVGGETGEQGGREVTVHQAPLEGLGQPRVGLERPFRVRHEGLGLLLEGVPEGPPSSGRSSQ